MGVGQRLGALDDHHVGAGGDRQFGGLILRGDVGDRALAEVIGDDETAEPLLRAELTVDRRLRDAGGLALGREAGDLGVPDHDRRHAGVDRLLERHQVGSLQFGQRRNGGEPAGRVLVTVADPRPVLHDGEHARFLDGRNDGVDERRDLRRVGSIGASTHPRTGAQVGARRQRHVDTEFLQLDRVLAHRRGGLLRGALRLLRRSRNRTRGVGEGLDSAALLVGGDDDAHGGALDGVGDLGVRLRRLLAGQHNAADRSLSEHVARLVRRVDHGPHHLGGLGLGREHLCTVRRLRGGHLDERRRRHHRDLGARRAGTRGGDGDHAGQDEREVAPRPANPAPDAAHEPRP